MTFCCCHGKGRCFVCSMNYNWFTLIYFIFFCVEQRSAHFLFKGPGNKYLRLQGPYGYYSNYSTLPLWQKSFQRQSENKWAWLCANKTLFTKKRGWTGLGPQAVPCWPLLRRMGEKKANYGVSLAFHPGESPGTRTWHFSWPPRASVYWLSNGNNGHYKPWLLR